MLLLIADCDLSNVILPALLLNCARLSLDMGLIPHHPTIPGHLLAICSGMIAGNCSLDGQLNEF